MKMFDFINKDNLKGNLQAVGMKISQAKPELLLIFGGLSLLTGTIYACTKTEKAKEAILEAKEECKKVEKTIVMPSEESGIEVLPETKRQIKVERGRQYVKIYGKLVYDMIKLYGIPAILWFGGFGMITGGHVELRKMNKNLAAQVFASSQLINEYRARVADTIGKDAEEKLFMGKQVEDGEILVRETDPETGEETVVKKKDGKFYAQPGSIFARNFTPETTDILYRQFTDEYLDDRVRKINYALEVGMARAYTGIDILRQLGFDENALGTDEEIDALLANGISANPRKVPDPQMRQLKITKMRGYQKKWDAERGVEVYEPCLRVDFNFYPLAGKI